MKLRDYQQKAVDAVFKEWEEHSSTLVVMPTGTGKTVMFAEILRRVQPARGMVLAHREELIWQARDKVERMLGAECEVEMADLTASTSLFHQAPVVISTIQTQVSGPEGKTRMTRFSPEDFGVVVVDEAHHATADTYRRILEHYRQNPNLKVLGVTATPDRADEEALGQVFESVAFDYEVLDAIQDGYLVPIEQQMVTVEGLDFSQVHTTAGDLNGGELAEVMELEKNLHCVASAALDIIKDRKTLVFTVSVKQAEMLSDIFNRHKPEMAQWICGKTPKEDRRLALKKFSTGETQIMVNCGVLTEGYDEVGIHCIVQARPTKSRCLYSQMVGRATRPLAGVVDGLGTSEERKAAIANSLKRSMLVVDFVGNSGRHKLITTADILGGKFSDEEIELAEKEAREKGQRGESVDMTEELEKARRELEERKARDAARKARLVGKAAYSTVNINPFSVFDITPERERGWDHGMTLSEKQKGLLRKQGLNPDSMTYHQNKQVINEMFRRWNNKLCTMKQAKLLKKYGYETKDLPMADASRLINGLANNGWRWRPLEMAGAGRP